VIRPLARRLAKVFREWQPLLLPKGFDRRLVHAGNPLNLDSEQLFGLQLLAAALCVLPGFFVGAAFGEILGGLIGLTGGLVFGLALPPLWVDGEANKRQEAIGLAVPDSLELLVTCVEAGMHFDKALQYVQANMQGPLAEEYRTLSRELQMGIPRQEAFHRLLARNSSDELHVVVGAILQGLELGVPIGNTLGDQAEEMRIRRLQRAKEIGAKAAPKIALVTALIVAPAVMCLFLSVLVFGMGKDLAPLLRETTGR
jgi:tight adherence protein C